MAEPLKNAYSREFFDGFLSELKHIQPELDTNAFLKRVYIESWESKELKERMRHISTILKDFLPESYDKAIGTIVELVERLKTSKTAMSFVYMFLPDYIEQYGLDNFNTSIKAMEAVTQFTSCEFAVRPFLIKYPNEMMRQMHFWSTHENHTVRRFASEGCRPRLPWAMALPDLKKDPTPILPILENLKSDPSEFVRKSVANNLNDISKDNPELVIRLAKKWKGNSKETDWITKHACRTLLKQGNSEIMALFGYGSSEHIEIKQFKLITPQVKIGGDLEFSFHLQNTMNKKVKIRLEYAVYYQKANGTLSKIVYMLSEKEYAKKSTTPITRKQSFKLISTRRFHSGLHQVALIINGKEMEAHDFILTGA
jgi:3-methyladenine DNA glycosylase AlkC